MYARDRITNYASSYFPVYTIVSFKTRFKASELFRYQKWFVQLLAGRLIQLDYKIGFTQVCPGYPGIFTFILP